MKQLLSIIMAGAVSAGMQAQTPQWQYWFDTDERPVSGINVSNGATSFELDAGALSDGLHTLHFQVNTSDNKISTAHSSPFLKTLNTVGSTAFFYIDGQPYTNGVIADGEHIEIDIDAVPLPQGLHTIASQVMTPSGIMSEMRENVFLRMPSGAELGKMRCWYTLDSDSTLRVEGRIVGNTLTADLNLTELSDGLHSINFMLAGDDGMSTRMQTAWFFKLPLGGGAIKRYMYWVNDDMANSTNIDISNPSNPYTLAALIPLKSYPFRSSSFKFAVEDGAPVIYPRNDFNILFQDSRGYFSAQTTPYYDTAGRTPIDGIEEWKGTRQNTGPIAENSIKWYKFEARSGDSISTKLDKAAMFEVFAPDGTVLLSSSGAKAVAGSGAHATQTGTHYIAVHDPAKSESSVTVNMSKVDRHAILRFDPANFAAEGCVIFNIYGNGLEDIKDVELRAGATKLTPVGSLIQNWEFARFAFDFAGKDIPAGKHILALTFDDGIDSETLEREFTISEPVSGEIAVTVNARNNTITDPRTISVTLINGSNYAVLGVPFCTARTSQNPAMAFDFNMVVAAEVEDSVFYDTDNLLGKGLTGRYMEMIIPYLGPKESVTFDFKLERIVGNDFNFYAWCGIPWSRELVGEQPARMPMQRAGSVNNFNYTNLNRFQNTIRTVGGQVNATRFPTQLANLSISAGCAIAGTHQGLGQQVRRAEDVAYPGLVDLYGGEDPRPEYKIPHGMTPAAIAQGANLVPRGCNPFHPTPLPNNPENPEPNPSNTPVNFPSSVDPNDMLGYVSPGGTHYVGKDVKTLDYTVEFENDPEFATAAAMTIKIDNRLDGNVLELGSFKPVSLRIGAKTVTFSGESQTLVETVDMRPEINSIAQISLNYDNSNGEVSLLIETLDPYTMELTDNAMLGILPVNYNGNGLGEFCYSVDLKSGLQDGTAVENKASIVFDTNEAIVTPVWRNVTDFVEPVSNIPEVTTADNLTFEITMSGTDAASGIWCYDLYMRPAGVLAWQRIANEIEDKHFTFVSEEKIEAAEFMTVAYDRAGNKEINEISQFMAGDLNRDSRIDANDVLLLTSHYVGRQVNISKQAADLNGDNKIDSQDIISVCRIYIQSDIKTNINRRRQNERRTNENK